uniref:FBA_2 domain-containing protein n=1 Tax=Panagrellus redivivus TaxID=6233 RepID=A0A7E4ZW92_PANRE
MPYPIATLPYPFRRRLRQLLSPAELYQLQIATGSLDDNKDLLPLQTCNFIENLVFEKDDTKIALIWAKSFAEKIKLSGNNLYNVKNVHLGNLNESTLSDLEFHNVVTTNIANLHIVGCEVTIHFLASLSRRKVKPTFLKIHSWSSLCTGTAKFSQLFEVFPTLEECSFKNFLMSGWVESMVDYGRTNLEVMSIWNSNFRIMVDFKPVKLYQFVKCQDKASSHYFTPR